MQEHPVYIDNHWLTTLLKSNLGSFLNGNDDYQRVY